MQLVKLSIHLLLLISLYFRDHSFQEVEAPINGLRLNIAVTGLNVLSASGSLHLEDDLVFVTVNDELTFHPGTANLTQAGNKVLASVADLLSAFPELKLAL